MAIFKYQTVSRTILGDTHTPVEVYLKLRNLFPKSLLMECSDYHSKEHSHSVIGITPLATISVKHGEVTFTYPDTSVKKAFLTEKYPCEKAIYDFLNKFTVEGEHAGFYGLYGYTSFDAVRYLEHIEVKEDVDALRSTPDILYTVFQDMIVFDHYNSAITLITLADEGTLDMLEQQLNRQSVAAYPFRAVGQYYSTITDEAHKANIRKGIAHCRRGDVFQIVLSRRFVQPYEGDDFNLYRTLRSINPSPYLFYFDFGEFRVFGSSPETHCRIDGQRAYIDPIAGTTKRTGDPVKDKQNTDYLLENPKENAEHVMLVDLARNDLSRNCHDVQVDFFRDVQYYSHVIHLVSRVSGQLDEGANTTKAFLDTFPAGTLSGAPKVRAMQLISEYEPHNRGIYGGCIGCISFNGDLNQAITIRTFISHNGELWFQAGGGIVAHSDEEYELQEVNNKLGALRKAISMAEKI